MAYEWAKPGTKCICVDASEHSTLEKGRIYTILRAYPADKFYLTHGKYADSEVWVELYEAKNLSSKPSYAIERFRPLITKTQEQDVEMFLRLASPSPLERLDRLAEELDSLYND